METWLFSSAPMRLVSEEPPRVLIRQKNHLLDMGSMLFFRFLNSKHDFNGGDAFTTKLL
jgi:hypothetical protein